MKTDHRRLIDKTTLSDVRLAGLNFTIANVPTEKAEARASFSISTAHGPGEFGPKRKPALQVLLSVHLDVKSKDDDAKLFFSADSQFMGLFVSNDEKPIDLDQAQQSIQSFAKVLFPVARMEITRVLALAKFADVPLAWEVGIASTDPATIAPSKQKGIKRNSRASKAKAV